MPELHSLWRIVIDIPWWAKLMIALPTLAVMIMAMFQGTNLIAKAENMIFWRRFDCLKNNCRK